MDFYVYHIKHTILLYFAFWEWERLWKEGNGEKYGDAGEAMNTICEEIKKSLLFHQIHWIKVSLLCTQTSADKPQKYSMLFFAFYHFLCDMYLVWDWCWSFWFAQPDLFRTYKDSQTGNFCYTYCENVLFSSHDAIIENKFMQTIKNILKI